jgi:carbon monoxide dehydrogenase subunit G
MDMNGEYRIAASRERVWEALNDPEILRQAIPGCEELTKISDTELEAAAKAKVGPVSARFKGKVTLSNLNPPESYTLSGEGTGGAAGFAKGEATVTLVEDGEATILKYTVKASIGGKLAQVGQRLVDGAAKKMADDFFDRFSELAGGKLELAPPETVQPENRESKGGPLPAPANDNLGKNSFEPPTWIPIAIIGGAILFLIAILLS